jgi:signal peptidase I
MSEAVVEPAVIIEPPNPTKERKGSSSLKFFQWLAGVLIIAMFVMTFIVQAFEIPSESMEQTLLIGDYLLVNKTSFAHGGHWNFTLPYAGPDRGDIIIFRYPIRPSQHFVKRVVALPGDRIRMLNKQVFVNGQPLHENYTMFKSRGIDPYRDDFPNTDYFSENVERRWWIQMKSLIHNGELLVPPGQYFVLGDNRDESLDSRYWGFVPAENIVGRPLLIYWSVNRDGSSGDPDPQDAKLVRLAGFIRRHWGQLRWQRMLVLVK